MFPYSFLQSDFFNWVLLPLIIFLSRTVDVTLGTMRHIFIARGMKKIVPVLGFFEVLIWLITIGQIMQNLTNFMCYIGWAGGFAMGTFVGMVLEERLALGMQVVRIITNQDCSRLISALREKNVGVTEVDGKGGSGPVKIIFTVIERKNRHLIAALIKLYIPDAFYSVEDIRTARRGIFPSAFEGRNMNYLRKIFPAGKMK